MSPHSLVPASDPTQHPTSATRAPIHQPVLLWACLGPYWAYQTPTGSIQAFPTLQPQSTPKQPTPGP